MSKYRDPVIKVKIKLKTLVEESKIIRREERLAHHYKKFQLMNSLADHRKTVVRDAARLTNLAYTFMRGKTLRSVECEKSKKFDLVELTKMVIRFEGAVWDKKASEEITEAIKRWSTA